MSKFLSPQLAARMRRDNNRFVLGVNQMSNIVVGMRPPQARSTKIAKYNKAITEMATDLANVDISLVDSVITDELKWLCILFLDGTKKRIFKLEDELSDDQFRKIALKICGMLKQPTTGATS